jgi:DNA-directed RNA polymerase specialized sigma subunit
MREGFLMINTNVVSDFVKCNDRELRYIITKLCYKYSAFPIEDVVQEVYLHLLNKKIIQSYDSNFEGYSTKISTFLYPIIERVVLGYKQREINIDGPLYTVPEEYKEDNSDLDDIEIALLYNKVASSYEHVIDQNNISDTPDNLKFELKDFEESFLKGKTNKSYKLNKFKPNKNLKARTLSELFTYLKYGMTCDQIATIFGVSSMFVTTMKRELAQAMKDYGIRWESKN